MALEKTKEWETERLLVVQQLISEQHDNGISMMFSLKGLRRTRFQIPSIVIFSVTETTFFRELKRKRNLFERAEKNTQETTNIWLENRPKLRLNRKKNFGFVSLPLFLSLSQYLRPSLSPSLTLNIRKLFWLQTQRKNSHRHLQRRRRRQQQHQQRPQPLDNSKQISLKRTRVASFLSANGQRGKEHFVKMKQICVFFSPNNLLGGKRRMVSRQTSQSEFLIRRK